MTANTLVVTSALRARHNGVYRALVENCERHQIKIVETDAKNIWVKDWAPVQVGDQFIKFRYGYDKDNPQFPNLSVRRRDWSWLPNIKPSAIRLDGGNIVRHGCTIIMTDIIFQHNPTWQKSALLAKLEELLQGNITLVPVEPNDDIGHTDGICHFTPDGNLLLNDYSRCGTKVSDSYYRRLCKALRNFCCTPFPYAYAQRPKLTERQFRHQFPNADTFNSGYGYYINLLHIGKLVFLPQFMIDEDDEAWAVVAERFPGCEIVPIVCSNLSMEGGLVACVSQSYRL